MGKRSRRVRSSSTMLGPAPFHGRIGFDLNVAPGFGSGSGPVEFTIASMMCDPKPGEEGAAPAPVGFGEFLKVCFYCKKPMEGRKQVYMYRSLLAFCTTNCREKQMEIDGVSE